MISCQMKTKQNRKQKTHTYTHTHTHTNANSVKTKQYTRIFRYTETNMIRYSHCFVDLKSLV